MSSIAGIDYDSEGIFMVVVDEDEGHVEALWKCKLEVFNGVTDSSFNRVRIARDRMPPRAHWKDSGIVAAGIEEPYSRHPQAIKAEARVQGAILACLPAELELYPLKPHTRDGWKALTLGNTRAQKDEVAAWARASGCPPAIRQDFYDAFCIARAAREIRTHRQNAKRRVASMKGAP